VGDPPRARDGASRGMKLARSAHGAIWKSAFASGFMRSRVTVGAPSPRLTPRNRGGIRQRDATNIGRRRGEAAAGGLPRIASGRSTHRRPNEDAEQPRTKLGHAEQTRALELDHRRPTGLAPTPAQSSHAIAPPIHEAETGPCVRSPNEGSSPRA
jgi:hypothetical protein